MRTFEGEPGSQWFGGRRHLGAHRRVGQGFTNVPMLSRSPSTTGGSSDSAVLEEGDKVHISGLDVGEIQSMEIEGDHVKMGFTIGANQGRHREPVGHPHRDDSRQADPGRGTSREQDPAGERNSADRSEHHALPAL